LDVQLLKQTIRWRGFEAWAKFIPFIKHEGKAVFAARAS